MDDIFETIDGGDFAIAAFVGPSDDSDFVIFADRDGADLCEKKMSVSWKGPSESVKSAKSTLYLSRSSLLRGALMIVRRTLEGAEKCALRDFLREEAIPEKILVSRKSDSRSMSKKPDRAIASSLIQFKWVVDCRRVES